MRRAVRLLPQAEAEVTAAFDWYQEQHWGLGYDFLTALSGALERLARLPELHERVALRTRKALLRRFPYMILFAIENDEILVTAVFHSRRNPAKWADRVQEPASSTATLFESSAR